MKRIWKNRLLTGIVALAVVALGTVLGGDVIVQEGVVEGVKFKSTGCTAGSSCTVAFGNSTTAQGYASTAMGIQTLAGHRSTAMGFATEATGYASTAMGRDTVASDYYSTAMGYKSEAGGTGSTAMGYNADATQDYGTAIGKNFSNTVQNCFAVGYNDVDLQVKDDRVDIYGNLYVTGWVSGQDIIDRSSFYDKDLYGRALDYLQDSANTIKVNAEGEKEYNHEADPSFIQRWITVEDHDKYTEEEVWNDELEMYEIVHVYETHEELGSSLSAKLAWLAQCVFELKQENQVLKEELARLKAAVGVQ